MSRNILVIVAFILLILSTWFCSSYYYGSQEISNTGYIAVEDAYKDHFSLRPLIEKYMEDRKITVKERNHILDSCRKLDINYKDRFVKSLAE